MLTGGIVKPRNAPLLTTRLTMPRIFPVSSVSDFSAVFAAGAALYFFDFLRSMISTPTFPTTNSQAD